MRWLFLVCFLVACVTDEGPGVPAAGSGGTDGSSAGTNSGGSSSSGSSGSTSGTGGSAGTAGAGGTGGSVAGTGGTGATSGTAGTSNAGTGGSVGGTGGLPPECTPGVNQGCTCPSGSDGFRTCLPDSQWGPCGPCSGGAAGTAGSGTCGGGPLPALATVDWCSPLNGPGDLSANGGDVLCDQSCGYHPYAFTCQTDGTAPGADCQVRDVNSNVACCATTRCLVYPNVCQSPNPPTSIVCYYGAMPDAGGCISTGTIPDAVTYCCD